MDEPITVSTVPESAQRHFSVTDTVIAIISLFFGYAMHQLVFSHSPGVGMLIICVASVAVMAVYFVKNGFRLTASGLFFPVSAIIFSVSPFITGSRLLGVLSTMYAFVAIPLGALILCGNSAERFAGDNSFFDALKAIFVMPFSKLFTIFSAMGGNKKSGAGKKAILIIVGILLAIIPTMIIVFLLANGDAAFYSIIEKISDLFAEEFLNNILIFCFCLPMSMYFFGMLYANGTKANENVLTAEKCNTARKSSSFCPTTIIYTMLTPILAVYVIYFVAQFSYFTSAFSDLLPEGFTYAEYAREGFFQLCVVACINAFLIVGANIFAKREGKNPLTLRIYSVITSVFTLVLIATAVAKMAMYIGEFGLTQLRVYTTWFMALIALFFIFMIVRQFSERFNIVAACIVAFVIMFALLCFGGVDKRIAQYNINLYTSGKAKSVDLSIMDDLGAGTVEYILPFVNDENLTIRRSARYYFLKAKNKYSKLSWVSFSLDSVKAKKIVDSIDITRESIDEPDDPQNVEGSLYDELVIPE